MNIKKVILGVAALATTGTALFAFGDRNGRKQLFTNTSGICRLAQCFTLASGSGNGCTEDVQYYSQKVGNACQTPYNGIKTSTP